MTSTITSATVGAASTSTPTSAAAPTLASPSAAYTLTLRVELAFDPGTLGRLTTAIGTTGANLGRIDAHHRNGPAVTRTIDVLCRDEAHGTEVVEAVRAVRGVTLLDVADKTFALHEGGKIRVTPSFALETRDDLSIAYTPGVARVSAAIATDPERVWDYAIKRNAVAVLTDHSAVLGLGNIGPEAALPVMEGKAMLLKQLADVDAYPICLDTQDVDEIVRTAQLLAPGFGGINLEDISAPRCFEVERRLQEVLDIPVFHDDQHGTATVVLAALRSAAGVVGKDLASLRVVVIGVGAAGAAITSLLHQAGVRDLLAVDGVGILHRGLDGLDASHRRIVEITNPREVTGGIPEALVGADVMIGVSGPRIVRPEWVARMASDAVVFAMANPTPEILREEIPANVAVVGTGRSDYPNQINNTLVFPGMFRGLLDARASRVVPQMQLAAAEALAAIVTEDGPTADYVIPSVFDPRVAVAVADAVRRVARADLLDRAGATALA